MKISDILKLFPSEILSLSSRELRKFTKSLSDAANKRIKRITRAGLFDVSGAAGSASRGGKFSTRGKSLNELRKEFKRASIFLKSETGTVRGTRQVLEKTRANLSAALSYDLTGEQTAAIIKAYSKLEKMSGAVADRGFTYELMNQLSDRIAGGMTPEAAALNVRDRLNSIYEEYQRRETGTESGDLSSFFI